MSSAQSQAHSRRSVCSARAGGEPDIAWGEGASQGKGHLKEPGEVSGDTDTGGGLGVLVAGIVGTSHTPAPQVDLHQ